MVKPDADGRGGAGDEAEEPRRCGGMHPPARSHDRHRIQLTPRPSQEQLKGRAVRSNKPILHTHANSPVSLASSISEN